MPMTPSGRAQLETHLKQRLEVELREELERQARLARSVNAFAVLLAFVGVLLCLAFVVGGT